MSAVDAVAFAGLAIGAGLSGLRWLRVAQREHYQAGAVSRFAWRWWASGVANGTLGALAVAGAGMALPLGWPALVTAAAVGAGPAGLGARGRTARLRWTRRLSLLAVTAGVIAVGLTAGVAEGLGARAGLLAGSLVAVGSPFVVDAALAVLAPAEDAVAARYVSRAQDRLARVRPKVVGITGSFGKTTTKGYVAHLLAGRYAVVASPKSFNNRGGLTRTVNELLAPGTDVLVAEMGAYRRGEIRALCAWMPPTVAVLTAVGPVHLERFKTMEAIVEAKAEITERAEIVVCNVDDERLGRLAEGLASSGREVVRCSGGGQGVARADVAVVAAGGGTLALRVGGREVGEAPLGTPVAPETLSNVAVAVGAALALGCGPEEVLGRVGTLPGAASRLAASRTETGVVVLDDTFNANPAGARVALATLARSGRDGQRRVVVTPGMVELGPRQARENAAFAQAAASVATDVVVVGRTNRRALLAGVAAALGAGESCARVIVLPSRDAAVAWVRRELAEGDAVLYENDLPDHFP